MSWTANEKRNLAFVLLFVAAYTNSFVAVPAAHSMFTNACKKEAMGHFCDTYGGCENQSYAVDYERDGFCVGTATPYESLKNCEDNGGSWAAAEKIESQYVPTFAMNWKNVDDMVYYISNCITLILLVVFGGCIDVSATALRSFLSTGAILQLVVSILIYVYDNGDAESTNLTYLFLLYTILSSAKDFMFVLVTIQLPINVLNDDRLLRLVSNPKVDLEHVEKEKEITIQSQMSRGLCFGNVMVLVALLGGAFIPNEVSQEAGPLISSSALIFLCNLVGLYYTPLWRSRLVV